MTVRHPWPDAPGALVLPSLEMWTSLRNCLAPERLAEIRELGVVGYQLHGGPLDHWVLYLAPADRSAAHGPALLCGRRLSGEYVYRASRYDTPIVVDEKLVSLSCYGFAVALDAFAWAELCCDRVAGKWYTVAPPSGGEP